MVNEIFLKTTSADLLKKDYGCILRACKNKEFLRLLDGYMEIAFVEETEESKKVAYKYNLSPVIAYNLAENDTISEEIDALYEKYEQCSIVRRKARSMNTWMTKMIPVKELERYYKALCLLELIGKKEPQKCTSLNVQGMMQAQDFFLGMYRTCEFDNLSDEEYSRLMQEILRLAKKANKKLYRKYKNASEVAATEVLCDVYAQEKVLMKTIAQLAVLLLISFVDNEVDIQISYAESIPISLNYILQDFAECYAVDRNNNLPTPSAEQKKLIADVASGSFRCAYSQLYAEKKQHFAKFALSDSLDTGKYFENALVAYNSMYPDSNFNEEDINNYLIGAVYIQVLLDHLNEYQSSYEETLLNAENAKEKMREAEKSLLELRNRELECNEQFKQLEKEKAEMRSTIQEQEKQIESLQNKLQSVLEKKNNLQQKIMEQGEDQTEKENSLEPVTVSQEEVEKLSDLKACFIGGHPNFTKKVKQQFPKWKFIEEKQGNFPKNMLDTCKVIFQAENHCNHALSERMDDAVGKEIPCIFIGNTTNLTLCIKKMVSECKKRQIL